VDKRQKTHRSEEHSGTGLSELRLELRQSHFPGATQAQGCAWRHLRLCAIAPFTLQFIFIGQKAGNVDAQYCKQHSTAQQQCLHSRKPEQRLKLQPR